MLSIERLCHRYGAHVALSIEHFALDAGEHALVLGASGSGKTTLLHIVAGLVRPSEGLVRIDGASLADLSAGALDRLRGRTIGFVPQRLHLIDSLDVRGNLKLAQQLGRDDVDAERIDTVLESVRMRERARAYPHQLSQGQAQRVAIARAVINRPRLILADEPTANLDDANCERAADLLIDQAEAVGAALLIATHDQRLRRRFSRQLALPSVALDQP